MENNKKQERKTNKEFIFAVGRRREAVARVRIYSKISNSLKFGEHSVEKGEVLVNGKDISQYFSGDVSKTIYEEPLKLANVLNKLTITAKIQGGGPVSQLGAFVLGVSRGLAARDESIKSLLRKKGLLTRDQRVRERRKVGMGGKARRKKQSPKR
ncbi:MAG: mitochondrial small ribosomal subunit protein uS9m [Candidatus Levybacteria bacterium]|nr:mitochondrial small ribosomal subunit protein uS9m [Candidatus Levybacteria bacterium]